MVQKSEGSRNKRVRQKIIWRGVVRNYLEGVIMEEPCVSSQDYKRDRSSAFIRRETDIFYKLSLGTRVLLASL